MFRGVLARVIARILASLRLLLLPLLMPLDRLLDAVGQRLLIHRRIATLIVLIGRFLVLTPLVLFAVCGLRVALWRSDRALIEVARHALLYVLVNLLLQNPVKAMLQEVIQTLVDHALYALLQLRLVFTATLCLVVPPAARGVAGTGIPALLAGFHALFPGVPIDLRTLRRCWLTSILGTLILLLRKEPLHRFDINAHASVVIRCLRVCRRIGVRYVRTTAGFLFRGLCPRAQSGACECYGECDGIVQAIHMIVPPRHLGLRCVLTMPHGEPLRYRGGSESRVGTDPGMQQGQPPRAIQDGPFGDCLM